MSETTGTTFVTGAKSSKIHDFGWKFQSAVEIELQIPTFKVDLFSTFPKIGSKIPKISKFQTAVKIALVDRF